MVKFWFHLCTQQLLGLKNYLIKSVIGFMNHDQGSLVIGMVIGDTSLLPAEISHNLKITGMQHIASASGTNVGLILYLFSFFKRHFQAFKWLYYLATIIILFLYALLTGGNPPIVRATCMVFYKFCCEWFHRQYHPGFALLLVASSMIIFNHAYLESLSFQFSLGSSIGVIFLLPLLNKSGEENFLAQLDMLSQPSEVKTLWSVKKILIDSFYCTLAAQLIIWPLLAWHSLQISFISLVTNPLLLWLVPLITLLGIALIIGAAVLNCGGWWLWPWLWIVIFLLKVLTSVFLFILNFFGQWEGGVLLLPITFFWAIGWWLMIFCWARLKIYAQQKKRGEW